MTMIEEATLQRAEAIYQRRVESKTERDRIRNQTFRDNLQVTTMRYRSDTAKRNSELKPNFVVTDGKQTIPKVL